MRISIDAESCTGHGRCYALAPDLFEPDDEGHGTVTRADVPPELEAQARKAVTNCPEQAVRID
jgi:ferredoxin